MWFDTHAQRPDWKPAVRHLSKVDPLMRPIIRRVGPCTLYPRRDYFVVLCKAIFTQQISTAVAATLFGRFRDLFPLRRPTPPLVLTALKDHNSGALRHCGLSRQKAAYLRDLSQCFVDRRIPTRRL